MNPKINFTTSKVNFHFTIEHPFTKLHDLSGTGKTFLCESLKSALSTANDTGVYPVKDSITNENIKTKVLNGIDDFSINELKDENTFYIIDEADIYLTNHPEVIDIIIDNVSSNFMFILRTEIKRLSFDYRERAHVEYNENTKEFKIIYGN